jgi:20S proteasome alpha/beta subunit
VRPIDGQRHQEQHTSNRRRPITVIVWDGKTLAADRRIRYGSQFNTTTKIHKIYEPLGYVLCGGSGEDCFVQQMIAWVKDGRRPEAFPADQRNKDDWQPFFVIEHLHKHFTRILFYERTPHPVVYDSPVLCIGSGADYARAFLHVGKTAEEAVRLTCEIDHHCGDGIDILEFDAADQPIDELSLT